MGKKNYDKPLFEIMIIQEDMIRTSNVWEDAEKDPTTDDPFVGGNFNEND